MAGSKNDTQYSSGYNLLPTGTGETTLLQMETTATQFLNVSGNPNGVVPANPGSVAQDRTNGALYLKVSGTGTTVWQQIPSGTLPDLHTAKLIVGDLTKGANYPTIASAMAVALAGDTIYLQTGTYTENLTLTAGVNLCAFECDALTPNVTIVGKLTFTAAGTVSISGIRLQTNSDFLLAVTGTLASIVNLKDCYLNASNNSAISFTSSSASSQINMSFCKGNLGTTAINYITHSGAGSININHCYLLNTALSTTASTLSGSGNWQMYYTFFLNGVTTSSTSNGFTFIKCIFDCGGTNTTVITHGCTNATGSSLIDCWIGSGSASAVSVSASCNLLITKGTIQSSNTNAITGAGTISYSDVTFSGTSSLMNTTTQTALYTNLGKWKASGQPAFLATLGTSDSNVTGDGTLFTIGAGNALTEIFDQDSNFVTTGTFTAPVTGRYFLQMNSAVGGLTSSMTQVLARIVTSNRTYNCTLINGTARTSNNTLTLGCAVFADMDASDTCTFTVEADSGTKVAGPLGTSGAIERTYVSGFLVC